MTQQADLTPVPDSFPGGPDGARTAGAPPGTAFRPAPYGAVTLPFAPTAPPAGYVPSPTAAPEPPLNTLSVLSVVAAFVASPAGVVLGLVAGRQIRRTGERGRTLAALGTVLGSLFTVAGIATAVIMLVLVGPVSEAVTTASAPSSPSSSSSSPSVTSPAPSSRATTPLPGGVPSPTVADAGASAAGKAAMTRAYTDLNRASEIVLAKVARHGDSGDLDGFRADCKEYLTAVKTFRADLVAAPLTPAQRAVVEQQVLPVTDRVVGELQTLSTSRNESAFTRAANDFQRDMTELATKAEAMLRV